MVTIFAVPKPFRGHFGLIQRNAIGSWIHLRPQCQVILFGDEEGTAEVAKEFGVCHVPEVARNEYGTPLLNDVFEKAKRLASHDLLCYVNSDIILKSDFMQAVDKVRQWSHHFLMVGQCWDLDLTETLTFDQPGWEEYLSGLVQQKGKRRGEFFIDYFVFPHGLYQNIPPFALGRAGFDNWLIWEARFLKAMVVDVTHVVTPIHQHHDYSHVLGGKSWSYQGEEAKRNYSLAGGIKNIYSTYEATHWLSPTGLRVNWRGYFRLRARWENMKWHIRHAKWWMGTRLIRWGWRVAAWTRPVRHLIGLRMANLERFRRGSNR